MDGDTRFTEKDPSLNDLKKCKQMTGHKHYRNYSFYYVKIYLEKDRKETSDWVTSDNELPRSNLLNIINNALLEGRFIEMRRITMKEYAQKGGGEVPYCVKYCKRIKKGTPLCVIGFDSKGYQSGSKSGGKK